MDVLSVRRASELRYTGAPATSVDAMRMPANMLRRSFQSEAKRLRMKFRVEKERIAGISSERRTIGGRRACARAAFVG